jgi:5'-3' exonuclease
MLEVFKYTNRVVNMVRPRKLLFMAIGALYIYDASYHDLTQSAIRRRCASCQDESTAE